MTLYTHDIPGRSAWSVTVRAGRLITLTALGDDPSLSVLLFGSDRLDRLNIPDTLKAQMSACIRPPMVLMSDRGLALASVLASSLDWHDALGGLTHDGFKTALIIELAKHGLGEADLHGCINFFAKVAIDERGGLRLVPGHAQTGDTVTLRTEQDLLLVAATTPHPLDTTEPHAVGVPAGVRIEVTQAPHPARDDGPAQFRPESARALEQTRRATA